VLYVAIFAPLASAITVHYYSLMKTIPLFQVDAFTGDVFSGNPAAVCPLDEWLDDTTLQSIAAENNLAETAFFVPVKGRETDRADYHLRWFTPKLEVKLCGHATLASAFVVFTELDRESRSVRFDSQSGVLTVERDGDRLSMDFPAWKPKPVAIVPEALLKGLGRTPSEVLVVEPDRNYYAVFESESDVRAIRPDFERLSELHPHGVVVTAPGDSSDCASRYFVPSWGVPEDPVTGSIHCGLVPYWAARLDSPRIHARQVSERGGDLFCEDRGDRVSISGRAVRYLEGSIHF